MATDPDSDAPTQPRPGRLPLALALAFVAALGITYYLYVRDQRAYFSSRNLRLLETVSDQLDEALRTNEGFVRNYGASRGTPLTYFRGSNLPQGQGTTNPAIYLPGFDSASRNCSEPQIRAEARPTFTRTLEWSRSEAMLTIQYQETAAPLAPMAAPNGTVPAAMPDPCELGDLVLREAIGKIPLRSVLEPIFSQPLLSAFDDVMLVRGDGAVIFTDHQHTGGGLSGSGEEKTSAEHIVANLGTLMEKTGWRTSETLDVSSVRDVTRIAEVQSASGTYYLFTQPVTHDTVDGDTTLAKAEASRWIIAGIVSKKRFMYEVLSVSASGVLVVLALLVMMICAWPYLRASLIGAHQRLTIADVLLLGTAALIHASILTMLVIDVLAYRSLRQVSDQQLQMFGAQLERAIYSDLATATRTLDQLDEWGRNPSAPDRWARSDVVVTGDLKLDNPYVWTVAWIDDAGRQRFKAAMRKATPLVNVAHRSYFQDAKRKRLQPIGTGAAIESIRSSTTGETEVIVSKPSAAKDLPVIAATVQLVKVKRTVMPPGFGFAMIDDAGTVIFHSEGSRNNQENFFAETDWNRTVRSAVYARHERLASVRYWGEDHRVYVKPLSLPWTLIVFRNKSLLRTVNTEAVAMTLSMLLGNATIYLVVLFLLLLWNPRYRAPHVWPVARNKKLYFRLIAMYVVTIVSASVTFYAFDALTTLWITMLVPAQALSATLLIMERRHALFRWRAARWFWFFVNAVWVVVLLLSDPMPGTAVASVWPVMVGVCLGLLLLTWYVTFRPADYEWRVTYPHAYVGAGVLLLVIGAVVPAFGFFKVASRLEIEGLVKHMQVAIAGRVEKAIVDIERINTADRAREAYCDQWEKDPFETRWALVPATLEPCLQQVETLSDLAEDREWLPDVYQNVLPAYSEESVSLRQLHGKSEENSPWQWRWNDDEITLSNLIRLPELNDDRPAAAAKIYPGQNPPPPQAIHVRMRVPLSFAAAWYTSDPWNSRRVIWLIVFLLAVAVVIAILILIVRFFASKLFLIDLQQPLWLTPPPPLKPTLGDHVFLIRHVKTVEELTSAREDLDFVDITFEELDKAAKPAVWDDKLLEIDRAAEGRNVRVFDFEYRATDAGPSMKKLLFLERLLALPNRTVIVASTISPAAFLALITNEGLKKRWTSVLNSFVWATESQLEPAVVDEDAPEPRDNKEWLQRETSWGGFLKSLRAELGPTANESEREQLVDEILERSSSYYAGLWASCSAEEKILLHQLAREGLINGKDRKSVRRLLARGLVRRRPHLCLFNDTFRLYVLAAAKRERVPVDTQAGPSAWDTIRVPLFVVFISVVIMILATQKDMLNMATGLVAALTTGVPAIVRLFGFLTERRLNQGEKS